jgi:hypothetical protein
MLRVNYGTRIRRAHKIEPDPDQDLASSDKFIRVHAWTGVHR